MAEPDLQTRDLGGPVALSHVLEIKAYQPGQSKLESGGKAIKLSSNESCFGPSVAAIAAAEQALAQTDLYADASYGSLRAALSEHTDLPADWIACGNGSEELIDLVVRAYADNGDEVLYFDQSFPRYDIAAKSVGATPVVVPVNKYQPDLDDLLEAVTDKTKVVFLANPNNPTGVWFPRRQLIAFREKLRSDILFVIDSAYAEYMTDESYSSGLDLIQDFPQNTIMLRTFSKAYGLAGVRVGWAAGHPTLLDPLNRLRPAFHVNVVAQAAALAALSDVVHLERAVTHNAEWKTKLDQAAEELGFFVPKPSGGNFIFLVVPDTFGTAADLNAHLASHGIIARLIPTADGVRITIGKHEENEQVLDALKSFVA